MTAFADRRSQAVIYFAHGQESGPWGSKIRYLAAIAEARGLAVVSPDYSDSHHGAPREARLRALLGGEERPLLLAGSSMGAWVSCRVAQHHPCLGLFLMAPALEMPDHAEATLPDSMPAWLVHGWKDDVVPVDQSLHAAREQEARLLLLPDGHRLADSAAAIKPFFSHFLDTCLAGQN